MASSSSKDNKTKVVESDAMLTDDDVTTFKNGFSKDKDGIIKDKNGFTLAAGALIGKRSVTKKIKKVQTPITTKNAFDDLTENESNTSLADSLSPKRKKVKNKSGNNNNELQTMRDALKPTTINSSRLRSNGAFKLTFDNKEGKEKALE